MLMKKQNIVKSQNCDIWMQTVSLFRQKNIIFTKTLQKVLKLDLILQKDHCLTKH